MVPVGVEPAALVLFQFVLFVLRGPICAPPANVSVVSWLKFSEIIVGALDPPPVFGATGSSDEQLRSTINETYKDTQTTYFNIFFSRKESTAVGDGSESIHSTQRRCNVTPDNSTSLPI